MSLKRPYKAAATRFQVGECKLLDYCKRSLPIRKLKNNFTYSQKLRSIKYIDSID